MIYLELFIVWAKIGLFTYGGGYAMLPIIEKEVVDKKKWATNEEIIDYCAIAQCTPGPIALNESTFVGYKVKGILGGIVATLGLVFPSIVIILAIAALLSNFLEIEVVQHALNGINVSVCVLMTFTIIKLAKSSVKDAIGAIIFVAAIVTTYFLNVNVVLVVILAGVIGYVVNKVKEVKK